MSPRLRRALAGLVAAGALGTSACGGGLLFAKDARLEIVSPPGLAVVASPVNVRWIGHAVVGAGRNYAVFVDRLPVHPGQDLRALGGPTCGCVDLAWLNRHFVFVTNASQLELDTLPTLGTPRGQPDVHRVSIVIVDGRWRRVGEAAWTVTFIVRHPPAKS